jgi:hypothetical protein
MAQFIEEWVAETIRVREGADFVCELGGDDWQDDPYLLADDEEWDDERGWVKVEKG